ncbi:MAG: hypothetical protein Q8Q02_00975 [Nocardioides sp.]|nr:hypothetical protein [Nocardioides sp.]
MADKLDPTEEKLSLSMPSLRRRRRKRAAEPPETPTDAPAPTAEAPADPAPPVDAPAAEAPPEPVPDAAPPLDSGAEDTAVLLEVPAAQQPAAQPPADHPTDEEDGPAPWRQRVDLIPMLPGHIAALVTGAVVGLAGTALTYAGLQGCSSVRGTSTCGAPGFILLFAILVILVLLGSVLFSVWQIEGATSASVLGVGLTTVVVILFLTGVIFSPWMFLVVPVVGALAFFGSWWVTTQFVDEPVDSWR